MTIPRLPLSSELAVAVAVAATDDRPGIVVLLFDGDGLLVAVRPVADYAAATVTADCRKLVGLLAAEFGVGPAVVVTVHPGFGPDDAANELPHLRQCFETANCPLVDWLLVTKDGGTVTVGAD